MKPPRNDELRPSPWRDAGSLLDARSGLDTRKVAGRRYVMLAWLAVLGLTSACLYRGGAVDVDPRTLQASDGWLLVEGVPLRRQAGELDCGLAAMSALLAYWQRPMQTSDLRATLSLADDAPLKAGEIKSYLRAQGFHAFVVEGRAQDLPHHLAKGRPLLVGMLKPYAGGKLLAHYELVVGFHPERGVLTMDPGAGWRRYPHPSFEREWAAAGRLLLIAVPHAGSPSPSDT